MYLIIYIYILFNPMDCSPPGHGYPSTVSQNLLKFMSFKRSGDTKGEIHCVSHTCSPRSIYPKSPTGTSQTQGCACSKGLHLFCLSAYPLSSGAESGMEKKNG